MIEENRTADSGAPASTPMIPIPREVAPAREGEERFVAMYQGPGSNMLAQMSTRTETPKVNKMGVGLLENEGLKLMLDKYSEFLQTLGPSTHKLHDACIIAFTKQNEHRGPGGLNTLVVIPLEEYARLTCKTDGPITKSLLDWVRRRVKKDLLTLYSTSISWVESGGKRGTKSFAETRIYDAIAINNGQIMISIAKPWAEYLRGAYVMQYCLELFKVDERNPSAYIIGRKLLLHYGNYNNIDRGTANRISVKALLKSCHDIPAYEDVKKIGGIEQRIIDPFTKALDACSGFISWEYCNEKGTVLTEEQIESEKKKPLAYDDFITRYIKFTVKNYPDQTERLTAKEEQKALAFEIQKKPRKKRTGMQRAGLQK